MGLTKASHTSERESTMKAADVAIRINAISSHQMEREKVELVAAPSIPLPSFTVWASVSQHQVG